MSAAYSIPAAPVTVSGEIKRSDFITCIAHTPGREAVATFIQSCRDAHPKANHHCYAFIAGAPYDDTSHGSSDDGEPAGSAGRPMLNVLSHSGIGEITVVVIRYFGGIKLGVGGLVRAYSQSTQDGLKELLLQQFTPRFPLWLRCDYSTHAQLLRRLPEWDAKVEQEHFAADITLCMAVPSALRDQACQSLLQLGCQLCDPPA